MFWFSQKLPNGLFYGSYLKLAQFLSKVLVNNTLLFILKFLQETNSTRTKSWAEAGIICVTNWQDFNYLYGEIIRQGCLCTTWLKVPYFIHFSSYLCRCVNEPNSVKQVLWSQSQVCLTAAFHVRPTEISKYFRLILCLNHSETNVRTSSLQENNKKPDTSFLNNAKLLFDFYLRALLTLIFQIRVSQVNFMCLSGVAGTVQTRYRQPRHLDNWRDM